MRGDMPRRWELYHGNRENPIAHSNVYEYDASDMWSHIHTYIHIMYMLLAHLLPIIFNPGAVHWAAWNVIVRTVPLTWSESPLIVRPFAKFSSTFSVVTSISLVISYNQMIYINEKVKGRHWEFSFICTNWKCILSIDVTRIGCNSVLILRMNFHTKVMFESKNRSLE